MTMRVLFAVLVAAAGEMLAQDNFQVNRGSYNTTGHFQEVKIVLMTQAQVNRNTPRRKHQPVFNVTAEMLCISTGTLHAMDYADITNKARSCQ